MSYIFEVLLTIMYNNEQTFIISVCILQSRLFTLFTGPWLSLGMLVQVLWYHSPHLMHLAMSADHLLAYSRCKTWGVELKP